MPDQEQEIIDRMVSVYGESQNHLPYSIVVERQMKEIDHLYALHFTEYMPSSLPGKIAKKVWMKLTRPLFRKQVAYNAAVRELLRQTAACVEDLQLEVKSLSEKIHRDEEQGYLRSHY